MISLFPSRTMKDQPLLRAAGSTAILATLLLLQSLSATAGAQAGYSEVTATRDGIGKVYMGREIAKVMGHLGAGWLERPERVQEERTDLLLSLLALQPGDTVADIGAGTGYFSLPMARMVGPEGRVLAVDIQPEMLDIIERRLEKAALNNVTPVLATASDPRLPAGEVDAVLLVDAYHEFSHPFEVMSAIRDSLSEQGRVILVEYRGEDSMVPIKPLHKMTVDQATRELANAGLVLSKVHDDLPWQHIMVFTRAPAATNTDTDTDTDSES
ncbi:MAG: class I SAM-dependent methyltransferase [Halioglobus sp.]